jgi:hypothetical protein
MKEQQEANRIQSATAGSGKVEEHKANDKLISFATRLIV